MKPVALDEASVPQSVKDEELRIAIEKTKEEQIERQVNVALKKAGRIAAEGLVATIVSEDGKKGAVVEVNSETDFVSKNELFQTFVADVAKQALQTTAADHRLRIGSVHDGVHTHVGDIISYNLKGHISHLPFLFQILFSFHADSFCTNP